MKSSNYKKVAATIGVLTSVPQTVTFSKALKSALKRLEKMRWEEMSGEEMR